MSGAEDSCRIDVWLWRARFFKTRTLAARTVEEGGVRLFRGASRTVLDKPSRSVKIGDVLALQLGPRWIALRVEGFGERRGPAPEAQGLYQCVDIGAPERPSASGVLKAQPGR
jgi:ribosome-associated heat shock protein Hsp15